MFNFVQKFLNTLKLNVRINLFISALLIFVFTGLGYWLYTTQKKEIFNKADKQLSVLIEDLVNILEVQTDLKKNSINSSMHLANKFFSQTGGIRVGKDSTLFKISSKKSIFVKNWILDSVIIQQNGKLVQFLQNSGVEVASIYQKTEEGYLLVSTTLKSDDGKSALVTFIPFATTTVKTIEQGKTYSGRMFIDDWYFAEFSPIVINGEIKGMLSLAAKQLDYNALKPIFYNKTYFESGYPYIVSEEGFSVINKSGIEGKDLNGTSFLSKLKSARDSSEIKFRYKWPETAEGQWKWTYFHYFEPLEIYVATSVYEYELYSGLDKIRDGIFGGVIIAIILFFFGMTLIISPITGSIQKLVELISAMAKGKLVKKIQYIKKDEIGDIINSLNTLITGLRNTTIFSNEIGKGNFNSEFTPLSKDDSLGNSLLAMRKSLKRAKDEEEKRQDDDAIRKWAADGLAEFNDLVHQNVGNLSDLCGITLSKLVKYVKANQGGIFILNDEHKNDTYYELMSSYAYSRKKFLEKRIDSMEGLIGTCAIEQETIYMTDVPDDYVEIESGLGTANPHNILIVPIKLDNKVLGVVELATFSEFKKYEIGFVEKFAENFASTLNTVKINTMTKYLLEESENKSNEMQMQEEEMRQNLEVLQETQDVASRKQSEMEGILKALDTSFLVCELDMNANIVKVNNEFLELFKLTHDDVTDKGIDKIFNKIEDNAYLWSKLKEGNAQKREQNVFIGNKEYWLSETYTPILNEEGAPYKVLNIAVDITANKKQELKIQQLLSDSEKKAAKLFKQERLNTFNLEKLEKTQLKLANKEKEIVEVLTAIDSKVLRIELNIESKIININKIALDILGFSNEEMIGETIKKFIEGSELKSFDNTWETILAGDSYDAVVKRTSKNDKTIWLLISYSPIKDKDGSVKKVLFIANDITKQKLTEERTKLHAKKILEKSKASRKNIKIIADLQQELAETRMEIERLTKI